MKIHAQYQEAYQEPKREGTKVNKTSIWERDISFQAGISLKDRQDFYQNLAILFDAGLGIMDCLDILLEQSRKKKLKQLILEIQQSLKDGLALSEAFALQSKIFSPFEIYNIQMGEQTGKLAVVLSEMAAFYEKRIKLRRKVVQALSYPIAVICIASLVLVFMIAYVVPMFKDIFQRFDAELPPITQAVMNISDLMLDYGWYLFGGVGLVSIMFWQLGKQESFKKYPSIIISKIPLLGSLMLKLQLARFAYTFALLLKSKVNLDRSLLLLGQITTFYPLKAPLETIRQDITEGNTLFDAVKKHSIFPSFFMQIIRVGEKTARLDQMLDKLAQRLEEESEAGVSQLTQLLEPILIVFLGAIVGTILISMYLPMFELSNAIG